MFIGKLLLTYVKYILSRDLSLILLQLTFIIFRHNNRYQWLQINLGRLCKIIRVGTQGSALSNYWVTTYYLSSSVDGIHFAKYRQNSRDKVRN